MFQDSGEIEYVAEEEFEESDLEDLEVTKLRQKISQHLDTYDNYHNCPKY